MTLALVTAPADAGLATDKREAARWLRAVVAPLRLRVTQDAEGWPIVSGKGGQIEWYDGRDLAIYCPRPRLFAKLWAIPDVRRHQTGDQEVRAHFPPEAVGQVAAVIRARRRAVRPMTPDRLAALVAGRLQRLDEPPTSAVSRPQDRREAAGRRTPRAVRRGELPPPRIARTHPESG